METNNTIIQPAQQNQTTEQESFKVGYIVALKTHPFFENVTDVIISGDAIELSPLMVIAEIINDAKNQYDENTGNPISNTKNAQCKCIWYSHKSRQFEEAWINSNLLKVIERKEPIGRDEINNGMFVELATLEIELGKLKSSLNSETRKGVSTSKTITTALLPFVSPVMQVVELKKNEEKGPKYNSRTGAIRRFMSEYSAKCKWYNPDTDKMSEKVLPIEVLKIIPQVSNSLLEQRENDIRNKKCYRKDGHELIVPKNLIYKSGRYYIDVFSYLSNNNKLVDVNDEMSIEDKPIIDTAPNSVASRDDDRRLEDIVNTIRLAITDKQCIRIVYKNRNDIITTRTISNINIDITTPPKFFDGYCYTREELRTFRIERIQSLQILNMRWPEIES